jgi:hypothetical protein
VCAQTGARGNTVIDAVVDGAVLRLPPCRAASEA